MGMLSVFAVMLLAVLWRNRRESSPKQEYATGKEDKTQGSTDEGYQQQQPPRIYDAVISESTQLMVCVVLEGVCFVMIFAFFMAWLFVSRDILFFNAFLMQKLPVGTPQLNCASPPLWMAINVSCFTGIFGWFCMGVWILCCFVLLSRWFTPADEQPVRRERKIEIPAGDFKPTETEFLLA